VSDKKTDADLLRESELFDVDFYLKRNPDVRKAGTDPVLHYLRVGARDGRNPSKEFSTNAYLRRNSDVAALPVRR
jgi:predicted HicB family RNase H-like nuclease